MKKVIWTDKDGYDHLSLLRDTDPDHLAPSGIPLDPPSLDHLDWDGLKRELHNTLVQRELHDWVAVQKSQTGLSSSIISVFRKPLVGLYKQRQLAARRAKTKRGG